MFHVKPRQVQPGALVPRRTDDAPGVRSIGQHFRRVARRTVMAPQPVSRAAAALVAQALAVLARRARCPATRDSAPLARTPPAGTSLAMRLPVNASKARAASAKAALAVAAVAAVLPVAAQNPARRQAQVPVPRACPADAVPADAVPADAGQPVPTMARPPVPCPLGQNLIPRCPAVRFLVGRYYLYARYPAARRLADRSRAGRGLAAGCPARWRPGRCWVVRIPALRSAGRASIPASTARIPAAARARPNWTVPVPHRAASPLPASLQTPALWMAQPEMTCLRKGLAPPGLPMAAGLGKVYQGLTDARTSGPETAGRATTAAAVAHHPRTAGPGTTGPGATGHGTSCPRTRGQGTARAGTADLPAAHLPAAHLGTTDPGLTTPRPTAPGTDGPRTGSRETGGLRTGRPGTELAAAHPGTA